MRDSIVGAHLQSRHGKAPLSSNVAYVIRLSFLTASEGSEPPCFFSLEPRGLTPIRVGVIILTDLKEFIRINT